MTQFQTRLPQEVKHERQAVSTDETSLLPPLQRQGTIRLSSKSRDGNLEHDSAEFKKDDGLEVGGRISAKGASIHVSGVARDGSYVPPDGCIYKGERKGVASSMPSIYFSSKEELIQVLELQIQNPERGTFTRKGFSGSYQIQKEADGSFSVFYSGGVHRGPDRITKLAPQTFTHGVWNIDRNRPLNLISPQKEALQASHKVQLEKHASEILSRTDEKGQNRNSAGVDSKGGSGFYSVQGSISRHASSVELEGVKNHSDVSIPGLQIQIPSGNSLAEVAARRELSPAIRVSKTTEGHTQSAYAFIRNEGVRQGMLYISAEDPGAPSEVKRAYDAVTQADSSLQLHTWKKVENEAFSRVMVRSDGSVLIDKNAADGSIELIAPDFRALSGSDFTWKRLEMQRGNEDRSELDYVETAQSKAARKYSTNTDDSVERERSDIKALSDSVAKQVSAPGFYPVPGLSIPVDLNYRNKVVQPFLTKTESGIEVFVFPRTFKDKGTGVQTSGVLVLSKNSVDAVSSYDGNAAVPAHVAFSSISSGVGIEKWVPVENSKGEVSLRSDGSFLFRGSSKSSEATVYRPKEVTSGQISWDSVQLLRSKTDGRYYLDTQAKISSNNTVIPAKTTTTITSTEAPKNNAWWNLYGRLPW